VRQGLSILRAVRAGDDYRAWLFRILANAVVDWQRRKMRGPIEIPFGDVDSDQIRPDAAATGSLADPEAALSAARLATQIRDVVGALPESWQAVVHLNVVEGFSYKEVADILGCPVGTVMSRLYRARQVLRTRLAHVLDGDVGSRIR
jgi:RNA polymerase sigma-70 factor (ECF subfamily)